MSRSWAREREGDAIRGQLLAPIPRSAIYAGKAVGTWIFVLLIDLVLWPLVGLLFRLDLVPVLVPVGVILILGTTGYVAMGTLFSAMTVRTRARDLMLSVVLFPLASPGIVAGVVATREVLLGAPLGEVVEWLRILAAFDLVAIVSGLVLFEPLMSD
jgi:heme exporter protein B